MTLGIGIITYRRPEACVRTARAVMFYTKSPYFLVVAEDGGGDATVDQCRFSGVTVITGDNRGVCWNKNRALSALMRIGADPILLLEDDCYPTVYDYERDWIAAAQKFHHVNYGPHPSWYKTWCRGGRGIPNEPWLTWEITGQATITTHAALDRCGFLNTRFTGYGFGHVEWTERFCNARYIDREFVPCITGGLTMESPKSFCKLQDVSRNWRVFMELQRTADPYCPPWQNKEEMRILSDEIYGGLAMQPLEIRNA